jgi:hypothetical protein
MIVELDPLMGTISGKCGTVVFKTYEDQIVCTSVPVMSKAKKASLARFIKASKDAKVIYRDEVKRKQYEAGPKPGQLLYCYIVEMLMKEELVDESLGI